MLIEFHDAVESFRSIMVELENSMYEKDAHQLEEVRKRPIQLHTCLKVLRTVFPNFIGIDIMMILDIECTRLNYTLEVALVPLFYIRL